MSPLKIKRDMGSKKPHFNLRVGKDRLDLLRAIHSEINESKRRLGVKPISFNGFMEGIIEVFIYSKDGQEWCDMVNQRLESERKERNAEKVKTAMDEDKF